MIGGSQGLKPLPKQSPVVRIIITITARTPTASYFTQEVNAICTTRGTYYLLIQYFSLSTYIAQPKRCLNQAGVVSYKS